MSKVWSLAAPPAGSLMTGVRPPKPEPLRRPVYYKPNPCAFSQAEGRERRRKGFQVHYTSFDLVVELVAVLGPPALQICRLLELMPLREVVREGPGDRRPGPLATHAQIEELAGEVHEARRRLAAFLAKQLRDDEARSRLAAVVAAPEHSQVPEVSEDDVKSGVWAGALVEHVRPLSSDLAALVDRSSAPHGLISEVDAAIKDVLLPGYGCGRLGVDGAVRLLEQRVADVRERQRVIAERSRLVEEQGERDAERERRRAAEDLRRLGLSKSSSVEGI